MPTESTPVGFFHDVPILESAEVPECPRCAEAKTVVVQNESGAIALCMACEHKWGVTKIPNTEVGE